MNFTRKKITILYSKLVFLSSLSMRLTKILGKSKFPIHPKHLIAVEKPWYLNYIKKSDIILDIGCGSGEASVNSSKKAKSIVGFDIDSQNIKFARILAKSQHLTNVEFSTMDANKKLPFKNDQFTKIFVFDVLEHLKNRSRTIKEIKRILKKNGSLLLVVDNPNTSWKKEKKEAGLFYYADRDHKYEYPKEEIIRLLQKNKFEVISVEPIVYDTPLKPVVDLVGAFSPAIYKKLTNWRIKKVQQSPDDTTGYRIVCTK